MKTLVLLPGFFSYDPISVNHISDNSAAGWPLQTVDSTVVDELHQSNYRIKILREFAVAFDAVKAF